MDALETLDLTRRSSLGGWPKHAILAVLGLLTACPSRPVAGLDASQPGADAAAPGPADASAPVPEDAVAVVNGVPIFRVRLEAAIARLPAAHQQWARSPSGQQSLLDRLIEDELIAQEAHQRGVDARPAVVEKLEAARRSLLREALLADLEPEPITEADVEARRRDHPDETVEQAQAVLESTGRQAATSRFLKEIVDKAQIVRPESVPSARPD